MGISTDAILFYGVDFSENEGLRYEDLPFAESGEEDFVDTLLRLSGGRRYPKDGWLEDQKKAQENYPFDVIMHCSYNYQMFALGLKSTKMVASRGDPVFFDNFITPDPVEVRQLQEFLKEYDVEKTPSWILCSMMG